MYSIKWYWLSMLNNRYFLKIPFKHVSRWNIIIWSHTQIICYATHQGIVNSLQWFWTVNAISNINKWRSNDCHRCCECIINIVFKTQAFIANCAYIFYGADFREVFIFGTVRSRNYSEYLGNYNKWNLTQI